MPMTEFPGSWHAFELLKRLVFRGPCSRFGPGLAEELISLSFARIEGGELVATETGIAAERSAMILPLPFAA